MAYRIYIDETGTCSMSCPSDENNRYLCLTGVIVDDLYMRRAIVSGFNALKSRFFSAGTNVILHRSDILNKRHHFRVLHNGSILDTFNSDLLNLLEGLEYTVITAIIDKKEHLEKYQVWRAEPYHYCMEVILERYFWFLKSKNEIGDVLIESRSKKQDKKLKKAYEFYYKHGTKFIKPKDLQARLASKDIKFKPKSANIIGLQLADLLAHPTAAAAKAIRQKKKMSLSFGRDIAVILHRKKYYRSKSGKITGYGLKWLPE